MAGTNCKLTPKHVRLVSLCIIGKERKVHRINYLACFVSSDMNMNGFIKIKLSKNQKALLKQIINSLLSMLVY
jgi:hypothetical protein